MKQDTLQAVEEIKEYVPPRMVQIPLEEYRAYIESTIKGPTVEITLQEYNELRETNISMQHKIWELEGQIENLENQIENRNDLDEQTDIVTHMVADEMANKIIKEFQKVTDSVTKAEKNKRNGGIE
jgi:hypothetical protein